VEQWYWEVWNEANISPYWHGSPEEFFKLHDYAIAAVRRALPSARVGGPDWPVPVVGHGGLPPACRERYQFCHWPRHPNGFSVLSRQGAPTFWTVTCGSASAQLKEIDKAWP
jgi:xylan 1,4-beta-xylosidase